MTLAFDGWADERIAATRQEIEVVPPKPGLTFNLEPVSPRLKGSLIHPNKSGSLVGLRYSPDGQRIIAGNYPGGIVQVWDAASGKQLTKIETGYGYRGSADYLFLSPDFKTLYVSRSKRIHSRIEKDGKKLIRWQFGGDVRAWDLDTGEVRATFQHDPPRGMSSIVLSPDGSSFVSTEELPGEVEGAPPRVGTLWNVNTGQPRPLPDGLQYYHYLSVFSPGGSTLATFTAADTGPLAVKLIDLATASERLSIPVSDTDAQRAKQLAFSPDGRVLVGQVLGSTSSGRHWLKLWNPATGQELASFAGENKDYFIWMAFSADSRTLAVTNWSRTGPSKLFLFDLASRKMIHTVVLADEGMASAPAFSPDGQWIAAATQVFPSAVRPTELTAEDCPQPRIHLVEVASGEVRETIVAPQALGVPVCFSPDGKTLVSGGNGKVLLWDLTQPPGGTESRKR